MNISNENLFNRLQAVSTATISGVLHQFGITSTFIVGPTSRKPGSKIAGKAVTLRFMPKREDMLPSANNMNNSNKNNEKSVAQEYSENTSALWKVLDTIQHGDVLVIDARGSMETGCIGEMLSTYFKAKGGIGIIVDGCVRDYKQIEKTGVPVWSKGVTPNFASQTNLFPWDFNAPIACGETLVLPGDFIVADDDGPIVIPASMVEKVLKETEEHEDWEIFSKLKLENGGEISKYYPLNDEAKKEYEIWKKQNS